MIEEIGLAGARMPQGGEKSGEAYPEGGLPIDDAITYANGFVMSSSKDGGGLLIGEGLAARRDEGFGAVDPDILGKQARDQSVEVRSLGWIRHLSVLSMNIPACSSAQLGRVPELS